MKILITRNCLLLLIWSTCVSIMSIQAHAAQTNPQTFASGDVEFQSEQSDPPEDDPEEDEPDCD